MNISKPNSKLPKPSVTSVRALISEFTPVKDTIPEWLMDLVVVAYQNGRYDEACAETIAMAFD